MILLFQILTVFFVLGLFQILPNLIAGLVASTLFSLVAIFSALFFFRKLHWKNIAAYFWLIFLALFALPLIFLRIYYWEIPSEEIELTGIAFKTLHKASERAYLLSFFVSLIDYARIKRASS